MERKIYVISLAGKCGRELLLRTLEEKNQKNSLGTSCSCLHQQLTGAPYRHKKSSLHFHVIKELGLPSEQASLQDSRTRSEARHSGRKYMKKPIKIRWRVKGSCLFLASSHLRCVCCVASLQQELWPQRGGEALRQRVAVLARHDQMEGRAELGEGESAVPVHVAQLPETQEEQRSLQVLVGTTANEHHNFSILMQVWKKFNFLSKKWLICINYLLLPIL